MTVLQLIQLLGRYDSSTEIVVAHPCHDIFNTRKVCDLGVSSETICQVNPVDDLWIVIENTWMGNEDETKEVLVIS